MATNIYKERPSIDNFGGDVTSYNKAMDEYNQTGSYTIGQTSQPKVQQSPVVNQQTQAQTAEQQAQQQREQAQRDMTAQQRAMAEQQAQQQKIARDNANATYNSLPKTNTQQNKLVDNTGIGFDTVAKTNGSTQVAQPIQYDKINKLKQGLSGTTQPIQPQTPQYSDIEKAVVDTYAKAGITSIDPVKKAEAIANLQKGLSSGYYKDLQQAQGELEQTVYKGINSRDFFTDLNLNRDISAGLRQTPQYAEAKSRYNYILPYKGADYNAIYNALTTNKLAVGGRAWEDLKLANNGIETPDMLKARDMYNKQKYTDNLNSTMSQVYKQLTGTNYNSNMSFMDNMKSIIDQATKAAGITSEDAQREFDKQKELLRSGPEVKQYEEKIKANNAKKAELQSAKNRILDELKAKFPGATTATLVGISSQFTKDIDKQLYDLNLDSDNLNSELSYYSAINSDAAKIYQSVMDENRKMNIANVTDFMGYANKAIESGMNADTQRIINIQTNTDDAAGIVGEISSKLEVPIQNVPFWTNRAKELASTGMSREAINNALVNEMQLARQQSGGNLYTVEQAAKAKEAALDAELKRKNIQSLDIEMRTKLAKLPYDIEKYILDNKKLASDIEKGNFDIQVIGKDAWGGEQYAMIDKKTGVYKLISPNAYVPDVTQNAKGGQVPVDYQQNVSNARNAVPGVFYGECGTFVNNYLGIKGTFGDKFEDKMKMSNSTTPVPGGAAIFQTNTQYGHVGIVLGVSSDGKQMLIKDSNLNDDKKVNIYWTDVSNAAGFYNPQGKGVNVEKETVMSQKKAETINNPNYSYVEPIMYKTTSPGAIEALIKFDSSNPKTYIGLQQYGITPNEAQALQTAPMKNIEYDGIKRYMLDNVDMLQGSGWSDAERANFKGIILRSALENNTTRLEQDMYDFIVESSVGRAGKKDKGDNTQSYADLQTTYNKVYDILEEIKATDPTGRAADIEQSLADWLGVNNDAEAASLKSRMQTVFNDLARAVSGAGVTGSEEERIKKASALFEKTGTVNMAILKDVLEASKTGLRNKMTATQRVKDSPFMQSIIDKRLKRDFKPI